MKLKTTLIAGLLLTLFLRTYGQSSTDVTHYRFDLHFTDGSDSFKGLTQLTLASTSSPFISLDLISDRDGTQMIVDEVRSGEESLSFNHNDDILKIQLPEDRSDDIKIEIAYHGKPSNGLLIGNNKYGNPTIFGDNWPDRARHWLPVNDHPSDKATIEFVINAPNNFNVVATGKFIERKQLNGTTDQHRFRSDQPIATKVVTVGVADFAVDTLSMHGSIPITAWIYAEDEHLGFADYEPASEVVSFFSEKIAPYPYTKLANVQSRTMYGGLENAGNIFYHENSVTGKGDIEHLVAHEVAHQWFGNSVTETDWPHVWLSEGFATYLTHIYDQKFNGLASMKERLRQDREKIINFSKGQLTQIVDSTYDSPMELLNTNSYQKAAWVLHMLNNELGDEIFWKGIKQYYQKYAHQNASTADFQQVMEDASGQSLDQFFKQWLYCVGQPKLDIDWSHRRGKLMITINQKQATEYLFDFPLDLSWTLPDGTVETKQIRVTRGLQFVEFEIANAPTNITLDPNVKLLFESAN